MPSLTAIQGMLRADGLRLLRDRFLIGVSIYVIAISIAMRWAIPWIAREIQTRFEFDLRPYFALIVSHFVVQLAPLLSAIIGGFLLLESRENRTIKAMLVSPVPLPVYVALVCAVLTLAGIVVGIVEGVVIGIDLPPWPALVGAMVAGAPAAAALALFVAAMANNKVEAFAYLKFCGVAPLIPTGAYFLAEPWQWLAMVYPPYWASKAYWLAAAGAESWPVWVLGGMATSAVWVALLGILFLRRVAGSG